MCLNREQVEFVQAQSMDWETDPAFHGLDRKLLSIDEESGARTQLQRYPEGYSWQGSGELAAGEEFYVLDGSLYINQYEYSPGCYGYYPAGAQRSSLYVPNGAVILRFFDHQPQTLETDPEGACVRAKNQIQIECLDTYRMNWDYSVHDVKLAHLGFARKNLRIDPVTRQRTFLFMTSPQSHPTNFRGPQESHPTPEEAYQLEGDLTGHLGTMYPGAYFWRPPHIPHGPFGTRGGSLSLIRFVGGEHVNIWSEEQVPFYYQQAYTPVLPERLKGVEPLSARKNY